MPTKIKGVPVTTSQAEVYKVIAGSRPGLPDHALVPLAQHVAGIRLSSSGIRTRRRELQDAGLVVEVAKRVKMPSGRYARVHKAVR